ncbi:MAG: alpha-amylase family glycosyl hydrolase [Flavobacteriia bacterium]
MRYLLNVCLILIVLTSCKKDKVPTPTPPIPTDPSGYIQYGTPYASMPATEDAVIYEVNLRAFSSTGDLQGVINRLNEIKALGVNTIWLMPIYEEGVLNSVHSPYCVKDYKKVSTEYGSLEDLRTLTTQAHQLGMSVILDWVANHTSWDNAWITNHPDWYSQNAAGNIIIPPGTNWNDVADLNFNNADMKLAMIDAMKYWVLEANVDGFRCDYADGVPFEFWQQAIISLNSISNRQLLFLAEGTRADHYTAGFHLTYGWNFYTAAKNLWAGTASVTNLYNTHLAEYTNMPVGKHKIRFTTNHDESAWDASPWSLFNGKAGALAASVSTIFMGGVPLIYTGQEVGRSTTTPFFTNSPINWTINQDMLQAYKDMLAFHNESAAARKGSISNYAVSTNVLCLKKTLGTENVVIIVNVRNSNQTITVPSPLTGSWTNALTNASYTLGSTVNLAPYQYLILKN